MLVKSVCQAHRWTYEPVHVLDLRFIVFLIDLEGGPMLEIHHTATYGPSKLKKSWFIPKVPKCRKSCPTDPRLLVLWPIGNLHETVTRTAINGVLDTLCTFYRSHRVLAWSWRPLRYVSTTNFQRPQRTKILGSVGQLILRWIFDFPFAKSGWVPG